MPNKKAIDDFEPQHLKKANKVLQKHLHAIEENALNKMSQKERATISLWQRLLNLFK